MAIPLLAGLEDPGMAQNSVTGAVHGYVLDASTRAPLVDARVTARHDSTGAFRSTVTTRDGSYRIQYLPPGRYTIECVSPNYKPNSFGGVFISLNYDKTVAVPPFLLERAPAGSAKPTTGGAEHSGRELLLELPAGYPLPDLEAQSRWPETAHGPFPESPAIPSYGLQAPAGTSWANAPAAALPQTPTGSPTQPSPSGTPAPSSARDEEALAVRMLNLVNGMRSGNFSDLQMQALPLPGIRTFDFLALLLPGVTESPRAVGDTVGPGIGAGIGTVGQYSVNGMRSRANNFMLDGSDNNDQDVAVRRQGYLSLLPQSVESVQELQVATLLWDAELGRNLGAQVNAVSKGGSNSVHGQAYGFFTDSRLNARNFFDQVAAAEGRKHPFTRYQTGVNLAAPVARDRAHIFASFEHQGINALEEQHFAAPTAEQRVLPGLRSLKVVTNSEYGPNNWFDYVSKTGATPLGHNLLASHELFPGQHLFYPLPNNKSGPFGSNTLSQVLEAGGDGNVLALRGTWQPSARYLLSARYNLTQDKRSLPSTAQAIASSLRAESRSQDVSIILDTSLGQTLLNQTRISYGRTRIGFAEQPDSSLSLRSDTQSAVTVFPKGSSTGDLAYPFSSTYALGQLVVRPYSPVGVDALLFPQGRVNNTLQFADSLAKTWQRHTVRVGADIRAVQFNNRQDRLYRPRIELNNGIVRIGGADRFTPGAGFAAIGQVGSILQVITRDLPNSTIGLQHSEANFFVNHNYRPSPRISIDWGFRYERNSVPEEMNGRIEAALSLEDLPPSGDTAICGSSCDLYFDAYNSAVDAYRTILGGRTKMYDADNNNFGPHLGFALGLDQNSKTALRGGYGIYYDAILGAVVSQSRNVFPSEIPFLSDAAFFGLDGINVNSPEAFGLGTAENFVPFLKKGSNQLNGGPDDFATLVGALFYYGRAAGGLTFTLPEKHLRTPYVQQWHLSLERELGNLLLSAAYVGTSGRHLMRLTAPNGGPSITPIQKLTLTGNSEATVSFDADAAALQKPIRRSNPHLGGYQQYESSASSSYHALQLEVRRRLSKGITFSSAYTWAHAIDAVSDVMDTAGASSFPQDVGNLRAERGAASFDVRHRLAVSAIVDLPFRKDKKGGWNALLSDWRIASTLMARGGQPYTLQVPFDANQDGILNDRPLTTRGLVFANGHGQRRILQAADTLDFFDLQTPRNGLVGRNTARADGLLNWDLAAGKVFRLKEERNLEFRVEAFNVLNRANFSLPVRTIGDPGFGLATGTVTPPRIVQLALRLAF